MISRETFQRRGEVWLARGDLFPDALAASYPAGAGDGAPVVLTTRDELHQAAREEITRLEASEVNIVGSTDAISSEVERQLQQMGLDTYRYQGPDRFATARHLAAAAPDDHFGVAFVATGLDFADALVAGPLAYELRRPIFLTTPDHLHPHADSGLRERGILEVVIVGGHEAVSEQVRREIEAICSDAGECIRVRRIGGRDRTETAALLADEFVDAVGEPTHVNLARGDAFPDAAAGGPHGGEEQAPILLARNPTVLGAAAKQWLEAHAPTIGSLHAFGTRDALSDEVVEEARQAVD